MYKQRICTEGATKRVHTISYEIPQTFTVDYVLTTMKIELPSWLHLLAWQVNLHEEAASSQHENPHEGHIAVFQLLVQGHAVCRPHNSCVVQQAKVTRAALSTDMLNPFIDFLKLQKLVR